MTPPSARPQADPATEMQFRTVLIQRDGEVFFSSEREKSEWSVAGNTAQAATESPEMIQARMGGLRVLSPPSWDLAWPLIAARWG